MTRQQALETARQTYSAFITARINHEFHGAVAPVEAEYGYRHGWVAVGKFNFGAAEMVGPNNQPYMD